MINGQRLAFLEATLDQLLARVRQERLNLMAKGGTPQVKDVKYDEFWEKLALFGRQLVLATRQLQSAGNFLGLRGNLAKNLPPAARYRERQSIASSQDRLQQVYEKAELVEAELRELYFRGQKPTIGDMVKAIDSVSKEISRTLSHDQMIAVKQQIQHNWSQFETLKPGVFPGGAVPLSFIVTLIVIYIHGRRKK
ncbi:MAG TPA: hypothetical protein VFO41_11160 [Alphaproteobacteria bacterium]|nr:hypothetical protein [Alphaproteobacteria bacterium]